MDITLILSLWGAILSTILTILKFFEYWNNRFRININTIFRSEANCGHDISISNLSSKPILLEYMELFTLKGKWFFKKEHNIWSPEDLIINERIEPSNTKLYNFRQGDYFQWNNKTIYIKLYFIGKKPIIQKIN